MTPKSREELIAHLDRWFDKRGMSGYGNAIMHLLESPGLRIVPVEPTEDMRRSMAESLGHPSAHTPSAISLRRTGKVYRAALDASPFAPKEGI